MKTKYLYLILLALPLMFMACSKDDEQPVNEPEETNPTISYKYNPLIDPCINWGIDTTTLYECVGYEPLQDMDSMKLYLYYNTEGDQKGYLRQATIYDMKQNKLQLVVVLAPASTKYLPEYLAERFYKSNDYQLLDGLISLPMYYDTSDKTIAKTVVTYTPTPLFIPQALTEYYELANKVMGTNQCYVILYAPSDALEEFMLKVKDIITEIINNQINSGEVAA